MTNFFGFYKYLPFGTIFYSYDLMYIYIFGVSMIFFFERALVKHIVFPKEFRNLVISMVILQIVEVIWTYSQYHQPIFLAFKEAFAYIVPIVCYFVFYQYKKEEQDIEYFVDVLIKCCLISSVVAMVAFFAYAYGEFNFLKLATDSSNNFRNGTLRFGVGGVIIYPVLVVSLTRFMRKQAKRIDVLNIIFTTFQIIVINKTRTMILYMIMMVFIMILFDRKMNMLSKVTVSILIAGCILGVILSTDSFVGNVTSYFNSDAGIMMRFNTIEFYMNQFFQKPLLGMGLISSSRDVVGWQLLYGPAGYYHRDDVGIVGLLNQYGICGLMWMMAFFAAVWRNYKRKNGLNATVVCNITIFLLVTLINLSFLDTQRTMYIFLVFAIGSMIQRKPQRTIVA